MKSVTLADLQADLERNPEDWSLRIRLIEGHILEGNQAAAARLVRESPGDTPLPAELQLRLHTVMTEGAPAIERYYAEQQDVKSPFVRDQRKRILPQPPQQDPEEGEGGRQGAIEAAAHLADDLKKKPSSPLR